MGSSTSKRQILTIAVAVALVALVVTVPTVLVTREKDEASGVLLVSTADNNGTTTTNNATADPNPTAEESEIEGEGPEEDSSEIVNATAAPSNAPTTAASPFAAGLTHDLTTPGTNTEYYFCSNSNTNTNNNAHHVVLLHGASFDRDTWTGLNIFQQLCASGGGGVRAVSAPELAAATNYTDLRTVLDEVADQTSVRQPVVLVTPSASAYSLVSAMLTSDEDVWATLPDYVEAWIPVAPVSLRDATDDQIAGSLFGKYNGNNSNNDNNIPTLAIYGSDDSGGQRLSQKLLRVATKVANATAADDIRVELVEIEGGHPAYRDSPDHFVDEILEFLLTL